MHRTPARVAIRMAQAAKWDDLQQIRKNYPEEIITQAWECLSDKAKLRIKDLCQSQTELK